MSDDPFEPIGTVAARVVDRLDPYHYWREKLLGHDPDPPEDRTQMPCGFWRLRSGEPLAVWLAGDQRAALRGFRGSERVMAVRHMESMAESGSFGIAVTEAAYRDAFDKGSWADDPPPPTGIGDNLPDDPFEAARLELADEEEMAALLLAKPIESQADADKCSTWARRVGLLAARADEGRKEEKAPHLAATREVDARWEPVVAGARELTAKLKKHVEGFLIRQKREAEAIARKAAEEADRLRREAAEVDQRSEAERADLLRQAQDADKRAEPKKAIAGRPNMRVSLRTVWTAVIVDYDKAFAAMKTHPDMREFVQSLADRACRAKVPVEGVEYRKEERAA
jgi:hypothetical protein